jgi:hypothetical protein
MAAQARICRAGQNHTYTVDIRHFWQGNRQIYGHVKGYLYDSGRPYAFGLGGAYLCNVCTPERAGDVPPLPLTNLPKRIPDPCPMFHI